MGRSRLIAALTLGVLWSPSAYAQQAANAPLIGILSDETPSLAAKFYETFAEGLRDRGWVEGRNIAVERRFAEGQSKILASLAVELVALHPAAIVAIGTPAARAAKSATETIPIVFARIADPVDSGLVAALGRPGGNLTGVSSQSRELAAKRLELLIAAVPGAKRIGVLLDPTSRPTELNLERSRGRLQS